MTPARFRKLALSLGGVVEVPHMDRAAFRTKRRIFATLGADRRVNLKIEPAEKRDGLIEAFPAAFHSLGGWTRLGYVAVDLAAVDDGLLTELVTEAWQQALPVERARPGRRRR
jgi:hypothetical protein